MSNSENSSVLSLARETAQRHASWFGHTPDGCVFAPGRIEILGNHTDYNEGWVLSAAIDPGMCATISPWSESELRFYASDIPQDGTILFKTDYTPDTPDASAYVGGMAHLLLRGAWPKSGACLTLHGNIPQGAGLSSSAALEISVGLNLCRRFNLDRTPMELARIAQRAEAEYAGTRCGLLDQLSSLMGKAGKLIRIDFRTLEISYVPMPETARFLVCNTGIRHRLAESAFNDRRSQCEAAVEGLARATGRKLQALRDVDPNSFAQWSHELDPEVRRRAAHVVGESERVRRGSDALAEGDLEAFGRHMFASHASSRENFENSCPELDHLVDAAKQVAGVYGARLTGGGFGGSVVILADIHSVPFVAESLARSFRVAFGKDLETREIRPSAGAHEVELHQGGLRPQPRG